MDSGELLAGMAQWGTLNGTGLGVTIYVVDSGIRTTHHEFISDATGARRAIFGCGLHYSRPQDFLFPM